MKNHNKLPSESKRKRQKFPPRSSLFFLIKSYSTKAFSLHPTPTHARQVGARLEEPKLINRINSIVNFFLSSSSFSFKTCEKAKSFKNLTIYFSLHQFHLSTSKFHLADNLFFTITNNELKKVSKKGERSRRGERRIV